MLLTQSKNLTEIEAAANLLLTAYRTELTRARLSSTREQAEPVIEQLELVLQDVASTRTEQHDAPGEGNPAQ